MRSTESIGVPASTSKDRRTSSVVDAARRRSTNSNDADDCESGLFVVGDLAHDPARQPPVLQARVEHEQAQEQSPEAVERRPTRPVGAQHAPLQDAAPRPFGAGHLADADSAADELIDDFGHPAGPKRTSQVPDVLVEQASTDERDLLAAGVIEALERTASAVLHPADPTSRPTSTRKRRSAAPISRVRRHSPVSLRAPRNPQYRGLAGSTGAATGTPSSLGLHDLQVAVRKLLQGRDRGTVHRGNPDTDLLPGADLNCGVVRARKHHRRSTSAFREIATLSCVGMEHDRVSKALGLGRPRGAPWTLRGGHPARP